MLPLIPNPAVPFEVLHTDDRLLVVAKPGGVVTEPGLGHRDDSLMNGLAARWGPALSALGEPRDHGLLHRLDRDASGAVLVALDAGAYDALRVQFERRAVRKIYLALVEGKPVRAQGQISLPIAEVRRDYMKIGVVAHKGGGEEAITRYVTLARGHGRSLLQVELVTGRLHQIRVHMAHLGCPVVHDRVYRADKPPNTSPPPKGRPLPPLALHAWHVELRHPDGHMLQVTAPLPEPFRELLDQAGIPAPAAPVQ